MPSRACVWIILLASTQVSSRPARAGFIAPITDRSIAPDVASVFKDTRPTPWGRPLEEAARPGRTAILKVPMLSDEHSPGPASRESHRHEEGDPAPLTQ